MSVTPITSVTPVTTVGAVMGIKYEMPDDFPVLKNADQVARRIAEISARKPVLEKPMEKPEKRKSPLGNALENPALPEVHRDRAKKVQVTIRLPVEVVEFFRGTGRDWQPRIGDVLLSYVKREKQGAPSG